MQDGRVNSFAILGRVGTGEKLGYVKTIEREGSDYLLQVHLDSDNLLDDSENEEYKWHIVEDPINVNCSLT